MLITKGNDSIIHCQRAGVLFSVRMAPSNRSLRSKARSAMHPAVHDMTLDALPEFQLVLQYLDVTSLTRLGATNRHHRHWFQLEVARRQQQVALLEQQMETWLNLTATTTDDYDHRAVTQHDFTREQVRQAMQCQQQAYAWISTSDPVRDEASTSSSTTSGSILPPHLFLTERLRFEPRSRAYGTVPHPRSPLALLLLPLCFYPSENKNENYNNDDNDNEDPEEGLEMMKADCRRLWSLRDANAFARKRASFVNAFQYSPERLDTFRAAARCLVLQQAVLARQHPEMIQTLLAMMRTTIEMIEVKLAENGVE